MLKLVSCCCVHLHSIKVLIATVLKLWKLKLHTVLTNIGILSKQLLQSFSKNKVYSDNCVNKQLTWNACLNVHLHIKNRFCLPHLIDSGLINTVKNSGLIFLQLFNSKISYYVCNSEQNSIFTHLHMDIKK